MRLSKIQLAVISLIVANTIWGAAPPIFKWSFDQIQPFTLAFLRFSIAALILYPFVRKNLTVKREDWIILLFISVLGLTFHIAYYYMGLRFTNSINAPIISSAAPIFIIIGSTIFFHEKLKKRMLQGSLISIIGILVIVFQPLLANEGDLSLVGNVLFIVSMGLSVFYTLLLKEIAPKYNPLTLTFWIFAITSIAFLPLLFLEKNSVNELMVLDVKSFVGIFFGAVLCSTVAYSLETFALKYISANDVAVFSYTDPIIAIMIARPLLGETVTPTFLIGSLLVFLGIFISEGRLHYHPLHLLRAKASSQIDPLGKELVTLKSPIAEDLPPPASSR